MRQWTEAERQRQAQLIRSWAPWSRSTGPKTFQGKAKSKMNAYKHGEYDCVAKEQLEVLRKCRRAGLMRGRYEFFVVYRGGFI